MHKPEVKFKDRALVRVVHAVCTVEAVNWCNYTTLLLLASIKFLLYHISMISLISSIEIVSLVVP